jgi:Uma2 family endonuclease
LVGGPRRIGRREYDFAINDRLAIMPTVLRVRERAAVPYHRWTVDEYHQMARAGLLDETDRVELIEGEMIDMAPIGTRHAFLVDRIAELLTGGAHASYMVRVQNPVVLDDRNEPQPDVMLVRRDNYALRHPNPADVLLVIEVSDTTVEYDRDIKLGLYARHGIPEVWLLNVNAREITVCLEPADGQYRLVRKPRANESVSPGALPAISLSLVQIEG